MNVTVKIKRSFFSYSDYLLPMNFLRPRESKNYLSGLYPLIVVENWQGPYTCVSKYVQELKCLK